MIIRDPRLILLNQTIAYKNLNLQFVNFTDNLLQEANAKSEDYILGKRDDQDLPWSMFAEEYQAHDRDALAGNIYSAVTPFKPANGNSITPVLCTRSKCSLDDNTVGVLINVLPLDDPNLRNLLHELERTKIDNNYSNYYIGKKTDDIHLTMRESECLFYLIRGKPTKAIARVMRISCKTVEFHIDNIKMKFNCRTKGEVICNAIQLGYMSIIPARSSSRNLSNGLRETT